LQEKKLKNIVILISGGGSGLAAIVRAAENCKVKKALAAPPRFEVVTTELATLGAA